MKKQVFLATTNGGKVERYRKLIALTGLDFEIFTPKDLHIDDVIAEEKGSSLEENARIKAEAYFGKAGMPILSNDTGFWVEGEGLVEAPKRIALGDQMEHELSEEEIASALLKFWKGIAKKHGGNVDAAWVESFIRLDPNGTEKIVTSRREVILTDTEFGKAHTHMAVRSLYISKSTGKPAILHTEEEETIEMQPVITALRDVLS